MSVQNEYWKFHITSFSSDLIYYFKPEGEKYNFEFDYSLNSGKKLLIEKLDLRRNGELVNDLGTKYIYNYELIGKRFSDKLDLVSLDVFLSLMKKLPIDLNLDIIFSDREVINICFVNGEVIKEFDFVFVSSLNSSTFIEAIEKLKEILSKVVEENEMQKIYTKDVEIFEEYLLLNPLICEYYGFIDNDKADVHQKIFSIQTDILFEVIETILSVNKKLSINYYSNQSRGTI